jgi:ABC-type lipoprotein export system ATPase subunit
MLTKLIIRNFKRFEDVEIELGNPVVFIGPNDSGKTTALQALAVWDLGLRRWLERRRDKTTAKERSGVAINRRDLVALPVPNARLLWRDLHVRDVRREEGKQKTSNIRFEIVVEGISGGRFWTAGLEFDYANVESLYCRPMGFPDDEDAEGAPVSGGVASPDIAFLPPMSGLADREFMKQEGETNFLIGQGRTAEVLRNLCFQLCDDTQDTQKWESLCKQMKELFGAVPQKPQYIPERSEIVMGYRDRRDLHLDLSCSGRGFQQTLLLLAYLYLHPNCVLLLDEPDAHLEILRQRQIYRVLCEAARKQQSQIIIASHSEVVLDEAAEQDTVVAFLGKPHRIDDRGSQVRKSLKTIGYDHYYLAERKGWVLYLEGSTDLSILKTFAETLNHPAQGVISEPFVEWVGNQPTKARDHFYGLREGKPDLVGFSCFDRLDEDLRDRPELIEHKWSRCEIENYLCQKETLVAWARSFFATAGQAGSGTHAEASIFADHYAEAMNACVVEMEKAFATLRKSPWSPDMKVSDDFLPALFDLFFERINLPNEMRKTNYHQLARFVPKELIDPEVVQVLDMIVEVAGRAKPVDESFA